VWFDGLVKFESDSVRVGDEVFIDEKLPARTEVDGLSSTGEERKTEEERKAWFFHGRWVSGIRLERNSRSAPVGVFIPMLLPGHVRLVRNNRWRVKRVRVDFMSFTAFAHGLLSKT